MPYLPCPSRQMCHPSAVLTRIAALVSQEVALIGMLAYLSYLCGELLGISGIVSLFCCGVVTSHYVSAMPVRASRQTASWASASDCKASASGLISRFRPVPLGSTARPRRLAAQIQCSHSCHPDACDLCDGHMQALHNVTTLTRATTVSAFQTLSYISEGCIFIYLGLDTLDPIKWQVCRVSSWSLLPVPRLQCSAHLQDSSTLIGRCW